MSIWYIGKHRRNIIERLYCSQNGTGIFTCNTRTWCFRFYTGLYTMTKIDVVLYGLALGMAMILLDYYFVPGGMY
jgi:hypothetical protein